MCEVVCLPKSEGGLGVKDLSAWNTACSLELIWLLLCNAGSLGIAWLNAKLIKGRCFWNVRIPDACSYAWRNLMQLHATAFPLFCGRLGDGTSTQFWVNNWREGSSPRDRFRQSYGISVYVTIAEVVRNDRWQRHQFREGEMKEAQSIICELPLLDGMCDTMVCAGTSWAKYLLKGCATSCKAKEQNLQSLNC